MICGVFEGSERNERNEKNERNESDSYKGSLFPCRRCILLRCLGQS